MKFLMRRRTTQLAGLLSIAVAVGAVVVLMDREPDRPSVPEQPSVAEVQVSWVRDYKSIKELLSEPNSIAIEGTVVSIGEAFAVGDGVLFTEVRVPINEVLAGAPRANEANEILVRQTGGSTGGTTQVIPGARLLRDGERVLLFAIYDQSFDTYFITGGPHGHYTIDGGDIRHANLADPDADLSQKYAGGHPLALIFAGMSIESVRALVRDAAETQAE
jgi:hypothetical protein